MWCSYSQLDSHTFDYTRIYNDGLRRDLNPCRCCFVCDLFRKKKAIYTDTDFLNYWDYFFNKRHCFIKFGLGGAINRSKLYLEYIRHQSVLISMYIV